MLIEITPEESALLLKVVNSTEFTDGTNDLYDKLEYQIEAIRRD